MIKPEKTLRPYQIDFSRNLAISVQKNKRVIACAPTGSGKSITMITIAWNAIQKGRSVFVISETDKIFRQLYEEAGGTKIADGVKFLHIENGQLYVCMAQTLAKRPLIIDQINSLEPKPIVIVDEAHIGTPTKILTQLNEDIPILGFTATPDARVSRHLPEIYKDCVVSCQVDDLIQTGFLTTYEHKKRDGAVLKNLKTKNGEYTERSQNEAFGTDAIYSSLVSDLRTYPYKKCVIYVASIEQCENVASQLRNKGIDCTTYHSKLTDGRFQLARFTELGEVNVIVTVASLTKGWDYKPIDMIVLLRKTKSLPLFLQMIGRGGRIMEGKDKFICLDYGSNWEEHGLWYQDREWDKMWSFAPEKGEGIAPVVLCQQCESIHATSQRVCPFCGFVRPEEIKESQVGEIEDITSPYNSLLGIKLSALTPEQLSIYAKIKSKQAFCARVARSQGVDFLKDFANFMGYKKSWVHRQENLEKGFTDFKLK